MKLKQITDFSAVSIVVDDASAIATVGVFSISQTSKKLFYGDGTSAIELGVVEGDLIDIDTIQFTTDQVNPSNSEGLLFYDNTKKALSYYNENADVTINIGQEVVFRVFNNSGSTIANGKVVYPDAVKGIDLADAYIKHKSRLIAVATNTIPDQEWGYITKLGQVGGLDTSSFSVGDVIHLGTNGDFTTSIPNDGGYVITVGVVDEVSATEGVITVDTYVSELTVEVTDTNGFPTDQRSNTDIYVTEVSREFTIEALTGTDFHYYQMGIKYEQTSAQTIEFTNVEGFHWFYFDGQTLTAVANPTKGEITDIIINRALVAYIYWDFDNQMVVGDVFDERHGISMSTYTHRYLHLTRGAQYISGLGVTDLLTNQDGSNILHSQFGLSSGLFFDEDVDHIVNTMPVQSAFKVLYLDGVNANLRMEVISDYAIFNAPLGRVYYNQFTGGAWQLTEATNGYFVLYHLYATNGVNDKVYSVMGQNQYATYTAAAAAASTEAASILNRIDLAERVLIGTVIFQTRSANITASATWTRVGTLVTVTSANHNLIPGEVINVTTISGSQTTGNKTITLIDNNSFSFTGVNAGTSAGTITYNAIAFTNTKKARTVATPDGDYVNWLTTDLAQGGNPSSHNNLTDVQQAGLGVLQGHIGTDAQTIYGVKTFNSSPIVPTPLTDYEASTKKYTDDAIAGLTKDDVGLSNVDNTSDANKPISTATSTALGLKADKINVLQLDNTTAFTPDADYEPATKKYVDDELSGVTFDSLSPTTTKGDIIVNNAFNNVRLGVGTNGQVLTADSTVTEGIKWATASGGVDESTVIAYAIALG